MDFERKSKRNQYLADQYKVERKLKMQLRPKMPAPRFRPGVEIPEIPEGMELHKFYGRPAFLPAREEDEQLVGRTPYTQRQMDTLGRLVEQRNYELFIKPEEDAIREADIIPLTPFAEMQADLDRIRRQIGARTSDQINQRRGMFNG